MKKKAKVLELEKNVPNWLNSGKCFICQEKPPVNRVITNTRKEKFSLCEQCTKMLALEAEMQNSIQRVLFAKDDRHLFQYTLGMKPREVKLKIEMLDESQNK